MICLRFKNPTLWFCLGLFVVAAGFRAVVHFHKFDDAFITFRYARNILEGHGFVYNPGERVLGTTTPLFTMLLAGLGFVFRGVDLPQLADWINRLADGGSAVLLFLIGMRIWRSRALAALLALFFALSYHSVFYASTGMETSLFSFLALFAMERTLAGRTRAALTLAALALMTRPDALILLLAIFSYLVISRFSAQYLGGNICRPSGTSDVSCAAHPALKGGAESDRPCGTGNKTKSKSMPVMEAEADEDIRRPRENWLKPGQHTLFRWTDALPATVLLALYAGALWLYFGSVVPHSMAAKSTLCPSTDRFRLFSFPNWYDVMMFWSGFLAKTHYQQLRPNLMLFLPTATLFVLGCVELARRNRRALLLPGFALLFFAAYAKSMVFIFPWYLIPTVPAFLLTLFAGLALVSERLMKSLHMKNPQRGTAAMGAAVLALQSLAFATPGIVPSAIARTMYPTHLEKEYRRAIGIVLERQKPPVRVLTPEIGFIGYYGKEATIIDAGGLTCPALVRFHQTHPGVMKNNELVNRGVIDAFKPDWIITLRTFFDEGLPLDPDFKRRYEEIATPSDAIEKVFIFRRR